MMKIGVKALRGALKAVKSVVETRNTIPILSNVVIRTTPGQATFIATDMDVMVERIVDLDDAGSNSAMDFTVHAATLQSIAAKLPSDGVATIEADGNTGVVVKCGRARFKLPTLPSDDFPLMVAADWDAQWEQPSTQLIAMLEAVRFAMSTEETRYYLNGVYLHVPSESECQFAAATDGHQLARYHLPTPDGAEAMPGVIVSRKTVKVLSDLLDDEGGEVAVAVAKGRCRFEVGATVLTAKTVDGTFPDYSRVIPAANMIDAWFDPAALAEAVDRVLTISNDKTRAIALEFAGERVALRVTCAETGVATEEVPIELTGGSVTIGFNGRYLLDVLGRLKGGEGAQARVKLADAAAPSLWQTSDDAQALYVLMPMRV